jgi:hypothetical protein
VELAWNDGEAHWGTAVEPLESDDHPTPNEHYRHGFVSTVTRCGERSYFVAGGGGKPTAKSGWSHLFELDPDVGRRFVAHVPKADVSCADGSRLAFQNRKAGTVLVIDATGTLEARVKDESLGLIAVFGTSLYFFGGGSIVKAQLDVQASAPEPPRLPDLPAAFRAFGAHPTEALAAYSTQPTYSDPRKPRPAAIWEGIVGWMLGADPRTAEPAITHASIGEGLLDFHTIRRDKLVLAFNFALTRIERVHATRATGDDAARAPPGALRVEATTSSGLTVFLSTPTFVSALEDAVRAYRRTPTKSSRPAKSVPA